MAIYRTDSALWRAEFYASSHASNAGRVRRKRALIGALMLETLLYSKFFTRMARSRAYAHAIKRTAKNISCMPR